MMANRVFWAQAMLICLGHAVVYWSKLADIVIFTTALGTAKNTHSVDKKQFTLSSDFSGLWTKVSKFYHTQSVIYCNNCR